MSDLDEIMNAPDLTSLLAQPTETKHTNFASTIDLETNFSDDFDFGAIHEEQNEERAAQAPPEPIEPLKPYDAKKHATALVNGLVTVEALVLTPVATIKARKEVGGNKAIKTMRFAVQKSYTGEKLTEQEETLIKKFEDYQSKMSLLTDDIIPSDAQKKQLIDAAIPYMEEVRWEIGPGAAFWGMYAGNLVGKVGKILLK